MYALITGVGGCVGGAMVRSFLAAGWRVTGVYRRSPPVSVEHPALTFVRTELRDCRGLPQNYDCLVHCAADVPARCADEGEMFRSNVEGTSRLLEHAGSAGAGRVIYMSSMAAFGTIHVPLVDEHVPPDAPDTYGRSKAEGERLLERWCTRTGRAGISLRLPGVVGAGSHDNFLSDTLRHIFADEPVIARHPEALFNNILHVDDLGTFAVKLSETLPSGHHLLTLAACQELRLCDVLSRMYDRAGRTERITWTSGGKSPFLISSERAMALGYRPATTADSIDRFVADSVRVRR